MNHQKKKKKKNIYIYIYLNKQFLLIQKDYKKKNRKIWLINIKILRTEIIITACTAVLRIHL